MLSIPFLGLAIWALIVILKISLFVVLLARRRYTTYPAFFAYIIVGLVQTAALLIAYLQWEFTSSAAWRVSAITQGAVLAARALAVFELCHNVLGRFRGVWEMAYRILLACAGLVFVYALLTGKHEWGALSTTAELGVELAMATVLVALLLLARYYHVTPPPPLRALAAGLCLYSCFVVLNTALLQRLLQPYARLWISLDGVAFAVSLLIWIRAFWKAPAPASPSIHFLDGSMYRRLSSEINPQLRRLSKALRKLWKYEECQP